MMFYPTMCFVEEAKSRETIANSLVSYSNAESREEKAIVVSCTYDDIRSRGGRFLKKGQASNGWYELSDQQTKEKIAHAVRDAVNSSEARKSGKTTGSSTSNKSKLETFGASSRLHGRRGDAPGDWPAFCPSYYSISTGHRSSLSEGLSNLKGSVKDLELQSLRQVSSTGSIANAPLNQLCLKFSSSGHPFGVPLNNSNSMPFSRFQESSGMPPELKMINFMDLANHRSKSEGHVSYVSTTSDHIPNNIPSSFGENLRRRSLNDAQQQARSDALYNLYASRRKGGSPHTALQMLQQQPQDGLLRALSDPFLDHINEVLGPLSHGDRGEARTSGSAKG